MPNAKQPMKVAKKTVFRLNLSSNFEIEVNLGRLGGIT